MRGTMTTYNSVTNETITVELSEDDCADLNGAVDRLIQLGLKVTITLEES